MKNAKLLIVLLLSIAFTGCNSDNEKIDKYVKKALNGEKFDITKTGLDKDQQDEFVKRYLIESTNADLMRIEEEMKKITPFSFNQDTNMTSVISGDMELLYIINYIRPKSHYRYFDTKQTTIRAINNFKKNTINQQFCDIFGVKGLLDLKVNIIFQLYDSDDEYLGEFNIVPQDCGY